MKHFIKPLSFALVLLLVSACVDDKTRYRRNQNGKSLYAVLHKHVSNGDTQEDIEKLLGSGEVIVPDTTKRMMPGFKKLASEDPDQFPDGILESDMLIGYRVGKQQLIVLMFRDGKIVNYVQNKFENYDTLQNQM